MPKPDNIIGKGNRFSSTNQPRNRGRKPSLYKSLKKLIGTDIKAELSKDDYYKLISFLLERPLDELKTIAQNEDTPVWIVMLARAMNNDIKAGRMATLDSLFDRLFGKSVSPLDINASIAHNPMPDGYASPARRLTAEQIKQLLTTVADNGEA